MTYTYYEQLNGYEHLKSLEIGYFFYTGPYLDAIMKVLDPALKTIVHIPNVNSRESTKDKIKEANEIMDALGEWLGEDPATGFHLVKRPDGRILKIADLVEDDAAKRDKVIGALKDPAQKNNRDHVDIIIALGMAKEGFDWIWCEHALTVGYRASLTEIIQIIGRATRDAPGKSGRPLHQSDRRAGRLRRRRDGRDQRHAEGDRRQPAHGTGSRAPLQFHAEGRRRQGGLRLWRGRLSRRQGQYRLQREDGRVSYRDQGARHAPEPGGLARFAARTSMR